MRVMCIDSKNAEGISVGNVYTVTEASDKWDLVFRYNCGAASPWRSAVEGVYFRLNEIPNSGYYHNSLFAPLSEIDERELASIQEKEVAV